MRHRWRHTSLGELLLTGFAAWVCLEWLATRPAVVLSGRPEAHFPVVGLPLKMFSRAGHGGELATAFFALVALTTLLACALALTLALRSDKIAAARTVTISLASGAACVAYVFFVRVFPQYGADAVPSFRTLLDFLATALMAMSLVSGMRFFARYPFPIDVHVFHREEMAGAGASALAKRWPALFRGDGEAFGKMAHPWAARAFVIAFGLFGAAAMSLGDPWWLALGSVGPLLALYTFWFGFACMRYKYKRSLEDDRRRIEWLYFGAWVNGLMLLLWAMLAVTLPLVPFGAAGEWAIVTFASYAPVVVGLVGLCTLAVSIFYRGTLDPNLAIRRTTVSALLLGIVTCLFVAGERVLAIVVAERLNLSAEMNALVAAGAAAALLLPMRGIVETAARRLVERMTPLATLGDGPRHQAAIAFSDLSGYTALTWRDERSAIVAAALFHREARKVAQAHGGRLVKTIGDAVHLSFPGAPQAVAAVRQLHVEYPRAAQLLALPPLGIHSGIHCGEVIAAPDGDVYGTVVNIAARLQGQAADGEIVVSQVVCDACSGAGFSDRGAVSLKNLPGKVQLFAMAT